MFGGTTRFRIWIRFPILRYCHLAPAHLLPNNLLSFLQMLRQKKSLQTMLDSSNTSICASKDAVINQLTSLADQLQTQIANYNATDAAKLNTKTSTHQVSRNSQI